MSADNGIYIVNFPDGYRVIYAQAIENIQYYQEGTQEYKDELKLYFGDAELLRNLDEAYKVAYLMDRRIAGTEYGVRFLGDFPHWNN